jgi:hypothetical protein
MQGVFIDENFMMFLCADLCAAKKVTCTPIDCMSGGTCNPNTGVCEEPQPINKGRRCQVGGVSGLCLGGARVGELL